MQTRPNPLPMLHAGAPAPAPCADRARRIGQVKFMALPLDQALAAGQVFTRPARLSPRRAGPWRALLRFLSRVPGRLVAARP